MVASWPWTAHTTDAPRPVPRLFPERPVVARSGEDLTVDGIAQQMRCAGWAGEEAQASVEEATGTGKARPAAMAIRDGDGGRVREGTFLLRCGCGRASAMRRKGDRRGTGGKEKHVG